MDKIVKKIYRVRLESLVGKRVTESEMINELSNLFEVKMSCFYADEQNALDHSFYFQKFDGTPDFDGTIYALPQRKDNDGEKIWYITEVSLD